MKLIRLTLEGRYKGLENQCFDFSQSTGAVAALVGLNGSGKSQFLELLVEVFAHLERAARPDFKVRQTLPFRATIDFEGPVVDAKSARIYRATVGRNLPTECSRYDSGNWTSIPLLDLPLPEHILGYSSGSNENLQRAFLKNRLQYWEIMRIRARRRLRLSTTNRDDHPDVDAYFHRRYPGIFPSLNEYDLIAERDTLLPIGIFLDYDCTALLVASLAILPIAALGSLLPELPFHRIEEFTIRYNLRGAPIEEDSVKDIRQLISLSGKEVTPNGPRTTDAQYDQFELDYLTGSIHFDFRVPALRERLSEAHYDRPLSLFRKLYRLQLLGVEQLPTRDRKNLRSDCFFGNVKMPMKLPSTIEVTDIRLSEGNSVIDFDDLSDGESQLLQVLGAIRIFSEGHTLFIFDEPDTHLNPHWRTRFHQYLTRPLIQRQTPNDVQVLISAHSAFMISSLRKENVFLFSKTEDGPVMAPVTDQTFGASYEVLTKRLFGLHSLISQTAVAEIKDMVKNHRPDARQWIQDNVGDSMEKAYLLRKLQDDAAAH